MLAALACNPGFVDRLSHGQAPGVPTLSGEACFAPTPGVRRVLQGGTRPAYLTVH